MVQLVDLTLVAWALSSAPGAAPGPRQAKPVRPTPSSSAVRRFEFTPALKLLPPNYSGDSIADYFRVVPKDQFETTAQYQERLAASPAPKAIAAFRLANVSPDYNADDRVLTITVEKRPKVIIPDGTPSGEQKNFAPSPTLLIKQDTITDRQYDATNAFGARFSVHETTYVDYSVLVDGVSGPSLEEIAKSGDPTALFRPTALELRVSMSADEARAEMKDIGVLAVCRVKLPVWQPRKKTASPLGAGSAPPTDFLHRAPTFSAPTEITAYSYILPVEILGFWMYNVRTGALKGKFNMAGHLLD